MEGCCWWWRNGFSILRVKSIRSILKRYCCPLGHSGWAATPWLIHECDKESRLVFYSQIEIIDMEHTLLLDIILTFVGCRTSHTKRYHPDLLIPSFSLSLGEGESLKTSWHGSAIVKLPFAVPSSLTGATICLPAALLLTHSLAY